MASKDDDRHQTPSRHVRVPDERWEQAKEKAAEEGTTVTEVINKCLERYIRSK